MVQIQWTLALFFVAIFESSHLPAGWFMIHNLSSNKNKDHDDNCSQKEPRQAYFRTNQTQYCIACHSSTTHRYRDFQTVWLQPNNRLQTTRQDKALDAANKAFDNDEEDVLFYIPVTKSFIQQAVISLRLICESSDRNIMFYVQTMYNYHVSLGTVFNILDSTADKALSINQSYDLSRVKDSAADELFVPRQL